MANALIDNRPKHYASIEEIQYFIDQMNENKYVEKMFKGWEVGGNTIVGSFVKFEDGILHYTDLKKVVRNHSMDNCVRKISIHRIRRLKDIF